MEVFRGMLFYIILMIFLKSIVRKVLTKGLNSYITKWDTPKQIAVLDDGKRKGYKSYVPDILVDYDPLTNSAKAVLDC